MDNRITDLYDEQCFQDFFRVIVNRPKRYRGAEFDAVIRKGERLTAATAEVINALGLIQGDTLETCAVIYDPGDCETPITRMSMYFSGDIADYMEEDWLHHPWFMDVCGEETFFYGRLKLLFGIEQPKFPPAGESQAKTPLVGFQVIKLYGTACKDEDGRCFELPDEE